MRASALTTVLLLAAAGCVAPGPDDPQPAPLAEPEITMFQATLAGVPFDLSALVWAVPNATTAVVLVHGHSGVKENYWHTAPELGASFGARVAATGRTVVALDLPGYGASSGDPRATPLDVMAEAVRAVAGFARGGEQGLEAHGTVVAFGLSMGAVIVNLAASGSDAVDAIVATGYPLSPGTAEGRACFDSDGCPEAALIYNGDFYTPNVDWAVANATIAGYETTHDANYAGYVAWSGDCAPGTPLVPVAERPCTAGGRAERVAADVRVPVFTWVGAFDLNWLGTDLAQEASYYPAAPSVDTWVVPDAGHFIHNHRSQPETVAVLDAWLAGLTW